MRITKDRIIWDKEDFLSGLDAQYSRTAGTDVPFTQGRQLAHADDFDPYRFLGYACPGFSPTAVTNSSVVADTIRAGAGASESTSDYLYLISNGDLFYRYDISANSLTNAGSWPHTIAAASGAEEGSSVVTYKTNIGGTRTPCVFYSYNRSTVDLWDVGIFNTVAGTFDDDWMSTVPATPLAAPEISFDVNPLPMVVGADDTLLIGSGNAVHGLDGATGTNGTFEKNRLVLPGGYIITAFALLPNYLAIFAHFDATPQSSIPDTSNGGPAKCFLWDYISQDPTYVYDIGDNVTQSALTTPDGSMACFTQGQTATYSDSSRNSRLQIFTGNGFETVVYIDGDAPGPGGCFVNGGVIYWQGNGSLHSYGSPFPGLPIGLNRLCSGSGTTARLFAGVTNGNRILMSTGTTTSGGLESFSVSSYATGAVMTTPAAQPEFPFGQMGKLVGVTVYYADTCTGGRAIDVYVQDTLNDLTQIVSDVSTVTSSGIVAKYQHDITGAELKRFDALRCILQWDAGSGSGDAPMIRRIEAEYESVNIKQG